MTFYDFICTSLVPSMGAVCWCATKDIRRGNGRALQGELVSWLGQWCGGASVLTRGGKNILGIW